MRFWGLLSVLLLFSAGCSSADDEPTEVVGVGPSGETLLVDFDGKCLEVETGLGQPGGGGSCGDWGDQVPGGSAEVAFATSSTSSPDGSELFVYGLTGSQVDEVTVVVDVTEYRVKTFSVPEQSDDRRFFALLLRGLAPTPTGNFRPGDEIVGPNVDVRASG